jgi:hypothetical protein
LAASRQTGRVKLGLHLSALRYLLPAPTGLILLLAGLAIVKRDHRVFLAVHGWFEIGIVASFLASVVYAIRLSGKGRELAPRWVFFLNLAFALVMLAWSLLPVLK